MRPYTLWPGFLGLLVAACNNAVDHSMPGDTQTTQNMTIVSAKDTMQPAPVSLKPVILNEKTVIENSRLYKSRQLTKDQMSSFSVENIDSLAPLSECTYHILDTLYSGSQCKILLIGRAYIEEDIIWAVAYSANNNLIDQLQVYYDNSEGSLTVESNIANNIITTKTLNDYAETEADKEKTETYKLDEKNKFVNQK